MGDNKGIIGVDANIVYVSDRCKNSEQRDDQCGGLRTSIHWPLRLNKGMSIAPLNINGLRTQIGEVALLIQNPGIRILALRETKLGPFFPRELTVINGYKQEHLGRTCHGGVYLSTSGIL